MECSFPPHTGRQVRQVLAVAAVVVALLVTAIAVPVAQADDLKDKHDKVKKHIKSAETHVEEASAQLTRAMNRVKAARNVLYKAQAKYRATRTQLNKARAADRRMRAKLLEARAELSAARTALRKGREAVKAQRTDIGLMAASNYQNGDPKLMQLVVILKTQSPSDMVTQMQTVDNLMGREERTLDGLEKRRDELAAQEVRVEAAKDRVARRKAETRANVLRKRALNKKAMQQKNDVLQLVRKRERATDRARQIRRSDLRKLRQLKKREQSILQKIREQAAQQASFNGDTGGFLSRPVPGGVTSPFGWREHPIYGYWGLHNGTDFYTPCGQAMRASASGRVAAAYHDSVYGNRMYVDVGRVKGKSMTLIYNHMSGYAAQVGERVERGEVVGYAGSTGWSTGCHLHFTVTLNGRPVNPMSYM